MALAIALSSSAVAQTPPTGAPSEPSAPRTATDTSETAAPTVSVPSGTAPGQVAPGAAGLSTAPGSPPSSAAAPAAGGPQLQEIVVTAQKRTQNLQNVPISVVAITGANLQTQGIKSVIDLGGVVPGLTIQKYNGVVQPFLRGVGNSGSAAGNESDVAVYVDGVYYARLTASFFDLADVDRVEVLKGPQGTLFGRNSTGGVINIVTRDPSFDPKVVGSFGFGNFDAYGGDLYATTKLTDKAAIDFSISGKTDNGFGKNLTTGDRYGYEDTILARSKLLLEPVAGTKIVLSGFYSSSLQPGERGGFPGTLSTSYSQPALTYSNANVGFYNTNADGNPRDIFKVAGGSARIEQELPFAKLVNITAYSQTREKTYLDGDDGPRPDELVILHSPVNLFTEEIQLVNKPGSPFDWIVGYYYYNNYTAYNPTQFIGPLLFGPAGGQAPAAQIAFSNAGFAQATYEILPKLKITGGIRYTADTTSAHGTFFLNTTPPIVIQNFARGTSNVDRVTYKAVIDYQIERNISTYASYSTGFKSGNYNIITYDSSRPTKPEEIAAYELGVKSELFDRRVRFNGALFYDNIKSPQVEQIEEGAIIYSNAGAARVKGAEFDAQAVLLEGLTGRASFTYLDAYYTNYSDAPTSIPNYVTGGAGPSPNIDVAGNRTPLAAKYSFNIGGDYNFQSPVGKWTVTADYYHNSGYAFEPDNFLRQGAYDLLSSQIKLGLTDHLAVRVFGKNLTNSQYAIAGSTQVGPGGYLFLPAPPRTYGMALDFNF